MKVTFFFTSTKVGFQLQNIGYVVVIKLLLVQQKFFLFHRIIRMEISGLKKAVPTVSELFGDMSYGPGVVTNRHFDTKNIARSHWSSWTGCY